MEKIKMMTFVLPISLLTVPCLAVSAQVNSPNNTNTNSQTIVTSEDNSFLTHENATLGISIQYPSSWLKEENEDGVMFISPPDENNYEASSVMVDLKIQNSSLFSLSPSSQLTLEDYVNSSVADGIAHNYSVIESNSTTLQIGNDNNTAYKLVFSTQEDEEGFTFQQMHIYAIRENMLYQIVYAGEVGKYSTYLPVAEKMIDSFRTIDHEEREGALVDG